MKDILERAGIDCTAVLDKTAGSMLVVDEEGNILFANEKAEGELTHGEGDLEGEKLQANLVDGGGRGEGHLKDELVATTLSKGREVTAADGLCWKKDGIRIPVEYSAEPLRGTSGEVIGAVVSLRNATREKELEEKLGYYRNHDQLTGLYNHLRFREELDDALNEDPSNGAVLLLDVDRLREVNNSFGPGVADNLLVSLSDLIGEQLRGEDVLARFGGDEFVILAPGKKGAEAREMVEEIIRSVRNHGFKAKGTDLQATISVGYVTYPEQGDTSKDLLAKADMALNRAKESGRNQYKAYDPDLESQEEVKSRVGWVRQIDRAIKRDNFVLYAQPILELDSEEISHYEVLIRMTEGEGDLISPGRFLPIAERFGLSRDIDRWVVKKTLDSISPSSRGLGQQFAINLSGQSLTDNELLSWLKESQTLEGGEFEEVLFEITETAALSNLDSANNFISALKARGSQFALDDFGMGFSSFNYLKQLSVDYLKIDGSFIQDLPRDSMNQNLVQSIVEVAHRLQKDTIAEFVESERTLELVKDYGSDHAQGYFIGRPQPLSSLF